MTDQQREELATRIVDSFLEVHRGLGPGLLETAYEAALCREFAIRKIRFQKQKVVPVEYKGVKLECGFRIDAFVEDEILLELKSVDGLLPIHEAQVINYLRLTGKPLGFLVNFNVPLIKRGIKRMVNDLKSELFRTRSASLSSSEPSRPSRPSRLKI
jgi:GxxExxY protein